MLTELLPFQISAKDSLHLQLELSYEESIRSGNPQVISFTAPTGSGKTIISAALIEEIFAGTAHFQEKPDSIIIWLSDSPQLNEQSKIKIETKANKIGVGKCISITGENFDREMLEDGHIYFLNTQKLGKNSSLTQHKDGREFTIWETLQNTIVNKSDRLLMIIDEAHRGSLGREAGRATTIMQKFIKGSPEDNLSPMPVVIGMSATVARFNALIGSTNSTIRPVSVSADDVRSSGLIKDRIIVVYPKENEQKDDVALLQAATDEWRAKCEHWHRYTVGQHYQNVNPVFIIQVLNGTSGKISNTNLNDCLEKIEDRLQYKFKAGEVVHAFGANEELTINGLTVPYVEPSNISDDRRIKVVFFKESLSTGWDCPRAETMMSFRSADDPTYIAQLLGRMIRTPLHSHILLDESLNDVRLFLPHFNKDTVKKIIEQLQNTEGGEIPTDVESEELETPVYRPWTVTPRGNKPKEDKPIEGQTTMFDEPFEATFSDNPETPAIEPVNNPADSSKPEDASETPIVSVNPPQGPVEPAAVTTPPTSGAQKKSDEKPASGKQLEITKVAGINRKEIVDHINSLGLLTYKVTDTSVCGYLESVLKLASLLGRTGIDVDVLDKIIDDIVEKIHKYIEEMKFAGKYAENSQKVIEMELSQQTYDALSLKELTMFQGISLFTTSDNDLERKLRMANNKLGKWGIPNDYGRKYGDLSNPNEYKVDVVLFANDDNNINGLNVYAENMFHKLCDDYRIYIASQSQQDKDEYDRIASNADSVSKHNLEIPYNLSVRIDPDGEDFSNHLYVDDTTGVAKIKLNGWESGLIREESNRNDFVCWIRNVSRASWALQIPYEIDGKTKPMYPDFIVVRSDARLNYVIDIMEPHGDQYRDNLSKAKGLANYVKENSRIGRVQLIREMSDAAGKKRFKRLDLSKAETRDKVLRSITNDDLNRLFETIGFFDDGR